MQEACVRTMRKLSRKPKPTKGIALDKKMRSLCSLVGGSVRLSAPKVLWTSRACTISSLHATAGFVMTWHDTTGCQGERQKARAVATLEQKFR